eukprot:2114454-Pyramimonas_sp.AAC.1
MRAVPLGPSVELPMGSRSAVRGGGWRTRAVPLGPSVKPPLWGHETLCAVVDDARGRYQWDFRWSPLMGPRSAALGGG